MTQARQTSRRLGQTWLHPLKLCIHELLDIAENKCDYLGTDGVQLSLAKSELMLKVDIKLLDEFKVERVHNGSQSIRKREVG